GLYGFPAAPTLVDHVIYLTGALNSTSTDLAHLPSGYIVARRASDGGQLWRVEIGAFGSHPLVDGATVYISAVQLVAQDTHSALHKWVYALNTQDGTVRWRTEITDQSGFHNTLMLRQGQLYITSNEICFDACNAAYVLALRASDGTPVWHKTLPGNITIPPLQ